MAFRNLDGSPRKGKVVHKGRVYASKRALAEALMREHRAEQKAKRKARRHPTLDLPQYPEPKRAPAGTSYAPLKGKGGSEKPDLSAGADERRLSEIAVRRWGKVRNHPAKT